MKKLFLLIFAACTLNAVAQTSIKMKTAKEIGDEFTLTVDKGLECIIDWGDGKMDTIISTYDPITGTVAGKYITLKANGLTYFDCSGQQINQLTFTAAGKLQTLIISNNKLFSCPLTNMTEITTLWCDHNLLTSLDLSKLEKLQSLIAGNNVLTKINRPSNGLPELSDIWINSNRIATLDLTGSQKVQTLNVENNSMTSMKLSVLNNKAVAVFMDGNALDFTSLWNKISVAKWYGTTQNIAFSKKSYNMGEDFQLERDLFGINNDRVEQVATSYTFTWYPYYNGVKGDKLVRGTANTEICDYTTPNTTTKKNIFNFKRPFNDVQLEIKNNKYLNFAILTNHISIDDPSAVGDATSDDALTITPLDGAVTLEASEPTEVAIYDTAGALRWKGSVHNATRIPLGKGIFIINNKKVAL